MIQSFAVLTLLALFGAPLTATVGTVCPMMAGNVMAPEGVSFSAQANPCCPKGACDCSIQADSPLDAQAPQAARDFSPGTSNGFLIANVSFVSDGAPQTLETSESPPAPDKPYKRTSQYRI